MGAVKKRNDRFAIIMNIVWSMIAIGVNYAMNFLITPYVTNNIGIEAFGFVSLANTFTSYIDIISIGLNAFACRYISIAYHRKDMEKANMYYSSTIIADLVLSAIVFIPSCVMIFYLQYFLNIPGELVSDVKILFFIVLIKYLLTVLRTAFNTATFIVNRLDRYEMHQSVSYIVNGVVLLALCVVFAPHVWYVGVAGFFAVLYLLIVNMILCKKYTPELRFHKKSYSFQAVRDLIASGIWNSLNNLGNVLNSGLDLLITNLMISATVLGQVSIAKNLALICYTMVLKISTSFRPKQLKLYAEKKLDEQIRLYRRTMRLTGLFCNVVICGFFACGFDFLSLWIPNQDIPFIFTMSMIVLMSDIATGVVNPLYYVYTLTKKVKIPCFITIAMGVANVGAMYLLIRFTSLGAYAVVLTTLVLNFVHFIDAPLLTAHYLKVKWTTFYPTIIRHVLVTALGLGIGKLLSMYLFTATSWIMLIVKCGITAVIAVSVLSLCTFGFKESKAMVLSLLKRKKKKA